MPERRSSTRRPSWSPTRCALLFGGAVAAALLLLPLGCRRDSDEGQRTSRARRAVEGDDLLAESIHKLNRLHDYVNLKLRPPEVILDATTSKDRRTVMAVITGDPNDRGPRRNKIVYVPRQNSRFQHSQTRIEEGDLVRYHVTDQALTTRLAVVRSPRFQALLNSGDDIDEEQWRIVFQAELENLDNVKSQVLNLTVARVINDSALEVEEGLPIECDVPQRMEVIRFTDQYIRTIEARLRRYRRGGGSRIGWEPTPDQAAIAQMIEQLNQWARRRQPEIDWQRDPLCDTLSAPLQKLVDPTTLAATTYSDYDGRLLQEAVWFRDVATWARGDALDDVDQAARLFDWTVRNIQLVDRAADGGLYREPWQTLLLGRGTVEERAAVFVRLARQLGLDVVLLAPAATGDDAAQPPLLAALLSDGEFYLFDPALGLPIPGAEGRPVATLGEVQANDELLRQLDLDEAHPYPLSADDLNEVTLLLETTPFALSRRAKVVESKMSGDERVVVAVDPAALAERVTAALPESKVGLWDYPYRVRAAQLARNEPARARAVAEWRVFPWRPALWKARVLHFRGRFQPTPEQEETAQTLYRAARPSDKQIDDSEKPDYEKEHIRTGKLHSSYWLGLLTFEQGQYDVAADYFGKRTLEATPDGPWTDGARYNLARTHEAAGNPQAAIALYEADESPQRHGNLLRARRLEAEQDAGE